MSKIKEKVIKIPTLKEEVVEVEKKIPTTEEEVVDISYITTSNKNEKLPLLYQRHAIITVGLRKESSAGVTYSCLCDDECTYDVPVISQEL